MLRISPYQSERLTSRRLLAEGPRVIGEHLDSELVSVAADRVDVILRDGRTLRLRPPGRDDADSLLEFFGSLSERSRLAAVQTSGWNQYRAQANRPIV